MSFCVEYHEVENYPIEDEHYTYRLSSFENCDEGEIRNPAKWAKAGFQWNALVKKLRCQYCYTIIDHNNQEEIEKEEHNAIKEHIKSNPTCKFIAPFLQKPKHPEMASIEKREETFKKIDEEMLISNEILRKEIVKSGLFCRIREDQRYELLCYYCNVEVCIIKNEEEDIGNTEEDRKAFLTQTLCEHIEESPSCAYMIQIKGLDFIEGILDPEWDRASEYEPYSGREDSTDSEHEQIDIEEIKKCIDTRYLNMPDAEEETDDDENYEEESRNVEKYRCKICLINEAKVLFLPCRHYTTCTPCNKKIKKECPICRQTIDKKINIFV